MRTSFAIVSLAAAALLLGALPGHAAQTSKTPAKAGAASTKHTATTKSSSTKKKTLTATRRPARPRPQMAPTPDRITEIQAALATAGSYHGDPNGKWDADTSDAMRDFQSAHGLNPSGKLDALTLQKLGLGSGVAGRGAPLPQPQASADSSASPQRP